jgi:hypothetical protein
MTLQSSTELLTNSLPLNIVEDLLVLDFSKLKKDDLDILEKKFSYLALNFDPYQNESQDPIVNKLIEEFQLDKFTDNPFTFTNKLLKLLDETQQKLKKFKQ